MCELCGDAQHESQISRRHFLRLQQMSRQDGLGLTAIKPAVIIAEKTKSGQLLDNAIAENVRRQVTRLKSSPPRPVSASAPAGEGVL
jgi:hypothetical protein